LLIVYFGGSANKIHKRVIVALREENFIVVVFILVEEVTSIHVKDIYGDSIDHPLM